MDVGQADIAATERPSQASVVYAEKIKHVGKQARDGQAIFDRSVSEFIIGDINSPPRIPPPAIRMLKPSFPGNRGQRNARCERS